jgi:hypothetical protein
MSHDEDIHRIQFVIPIHYFFKFTFELLKCHFKTMKNIRMWWSVFILVLTECWAYKPVFIIHGILAHNSTMVQLADIIDKVS